MTEITPFKVVWEICDLDAANPLIAAKTAQKWIKNGTQQYYVQNQKTDEIFSVDLQEEDDDAVLLIEGEYIPEIAPRIKHKKTYYLFGKDAIRYYSENGISGLVTDIEENDIPFGLFIFIEGVTPSIDLLIYANDWDDYSCITENEYNILNELL